MYNNDIPGWMTEAELQHIEQLANSVPAGGIMLEVGSFYGRSTWAWSKSVAEGVIIHCLDSWNDWPITDEGKASMHGIVPDGKLLTSLSYFEHYTKDCTNLKLIHGHSENLLPTLDGKMYDLIFLDGMHTNPILHTDIQMSLRLLKPGGLLCGHDHAPWWPDVISEVAALSEQLNKPVKMVPGSTIWTMVI